MFETSNKPPIQAPKANRKVEAATRVTQAEIESFAMCFDRNGINYAKLKQLFYPAANDKLGDFKMRSIPNEDYPHIIEVPRYVIR